jgi:N-acetylglucosamine-6-phosphate deacetylase
MIRTARRLLTDSGWLDYPVLTIEDGIIESIEAGEPNNSNDLLTVPFLDIHVHGAVSHDFMTATLDEIDRVGRHLARHGVGHYLPTTVTGSIDHAFRALGTLADAIETHQHSGRDRWSAAPVGVHLEGPFISHLRRGVHPTACILDPSIEMFDRYQQAARGHIRLVTLAPERPGALDLIRHATASGVRVSLGHSDATLEQTVSAITAGASSATHVFNAMRPLHQREPGITGAVLDDDGLFAEVICDGIHVHPAMIRLWLRMKGIDRAILVTDGISATGMPDGSYTLGDFTAEVKDGVCMADGVLSGSVLTMDKAVANLQRFTRSPLATAIRLATRNPARLLGMDGLVELGPGQPANFNIYDLDGRLRETILHGRSVSD